MNTTARQCIGVACAVFLIVAYGGSCVADAAPALINGDMSRGDRVPLGWERTHTEEGALRIVRDTSDFVDGPASLRLESVGGPASGNCSQKLQNAAGATFTVSGHVKAEGVDYATVAVMAQGEDWQMLKWQDIFRFADAREWTPFDEEVTVPENARNVLLMVFMRGEGRAWLDEVSVSGGRLPVEVIDLSGFSGEPPRLVHVCTVAPDVLALTVRAREVIPGEFARYAPRPGDRLEPTDGKGSARRLVRDGTTVGYVVGEDAGWLHVEEKVTGIPLQQAHADEPANYVVSSPDDPAYADGLHPAAVRRKSKAVDQAPSRHFPQEHHIYLVLPEPLQVGKHYRILMRELNVSPPSVSYCHLPREVRSEAVHVSQVGFRPDDPSKVAFLSLWMGTGGGYTGYREGMAFSVIDVGSGEVVHRGKAHLSKPATESSPGLQAKGRNFNKADVHELDFSGLSTPGVFRVCVEGVGCSYPFPVAEDVWQEAFKTAVRGYYHQRSGIALEQPCTDWTRPRGFHPEDGKTVYRTTFRRNESRGQGDTFKQLVAHRTDETLGDAWGGYFDAGDWDRHIGHLKATRKKLELLELFPDYFSRLDLNIPESDNDLPDLLDEALWNVDCYRRMQTPEGGIRGGIESEEHPAPHETSWTDTLLLMAFAPDYESSWTYAGVAARTAHWLETHGMRDPARPYRDSAVRAMSWAEREFARRHPDGQAGWREKDVRNLAALELYRLTGDPKWHELFRDTCDFVEEPVLFQWSHHVQRDAAFIYARLDEEKAVPRIKRNALRGIIADAEEELEFGRQTAFHWVVNNVGQPIGMGALSAPQSVRLLRAHALTGDERYLEAAVRACQFGAGANPMNMALVTGIGTRAVENLLVVDAGRMGRKAPPGLTPYGPMDLTFFEAPDWVTRWKLIPYVNVTPPIEQWPVTEAYWDIFSWPMMCEYTVHQGMPQTTYVWGYLAACR